MSKGISKILTLSALVLLFCGWSALGTLWSGVVQVFVAFVPFFFEGTKIVIENYLTSPYFITGVVMSIASACGVWFGVRGGKVLYIVISFVCLMISLASIGGNLLG